MTTPELTLPEFPASLFLLTSRKPPRRTIAPSISRMTASVTIAPMTPATAFEIPPELELFEELLEEADDPDAEPSSPLR